MAAQFCTGCGKPVATGSAFCQACGTPVASVGPATPPGSPPTPGPGPAAAPGPEPSTVGPPAPAVSAPAPPTGPPPGPPLSESLGLVGVRSFLLQHQLLSGARTYQVLTHEKCHLFTLQEDLSQELAARMQAGGSYGMSPGPRVWNVLDASGAPQGTVSVQLSGNTAVSLLRSSSGAAVVGVSVERSLAGGLSAQATFPDGRVMFSTQGNLLRHNFTVHDATGVPVAKIHEAWASVHDAYNLDLTGEADPLCVLVFAILIDREKAQQEAAHHPPPAGERRREPSGFHVRL